MRNRIWNWFSRNHAEGELITGWLSFVKAVLYPLRWLSWKLGNRTGFDWATFSWKIDGVLIPDQTMRQLISKDDAFIHIKIVDQILTVDYAARRQN